MNRTWKWRKKVRVLFWGNLGNKAEQPKLELKLNNSACCTAMTKPIRSSRSPKVFFLGFLCGGVVASLLVHLSPDQVVQIQALAGEFSGKTLSSHSDSLHPGV